MWKIDSLFYYPTDSDEVNVSATRWFAHQVGEDSSSVTKTGTYYLDSSEYVTYDSAGILYTLTQDDIFSDILDAIPIKPQWMIDVDSDLTQRLALVTQPSKSSKVQDNQFVEI